jgi:hypothetical protein
MLISETWINRTENYCCGEIDPYEPCTEDIRQIFRRCQEEYGRCVSKIYIDIKGEARAIGWVFLKKRFYEDTKEPYLGETWVVLHRKTPRVKTTYYYRFIA